MRRYFPAACVLLMLLCCLATYSNHFQNAFHFDDFHTVVNNAYIRDIHNIPLFFKDGTTSSILPANQSYRPVVTTSLAIDYWLGNGYNLFYFHLSMFLLFLLQGMGMIFIFKKIFDSANSNPNNIYAAVIGACWYLLHPAMAETVNYIIARSDIISTFFVVIAFLLYIYSPFCRKTGLYLIAIITGALAKPPAVMFAPILLIYILLFEENLSLTSIFKRDQFHKTLNGLKKSLPAFIVCGLTYLLIDKLTPKTWVPGGTSVFNYLITQPYVVLHYFYMLFFPVQLSVDTDWKPLNTIWDIRFFIGCIFILALLLIAFITSKREKLRPVSFGIWWFLIALIPTSSIIPLAEVMNDHRMYFPFIGLVLSVCWVIRLLVFEYLLKAKPTWATAPIIILITLLIFYAYGTYQRNEVWHSEDNLWHDAVIKSPKSGRALMNYGVVKLGENDLSAANTCFINAANLSPNYAVIYTNLGILNEAKGDTTAANKYFKTSILLDSHNADTYYFYGKFFYDEVELKKAVIMLTYAVQLSPGNVRSRLLLMDIYQSTENWVALQQLAQSSARLFPQNADVAEYVKLATLKKSRAELKAEQLSKTPDAAGYLDLSLIYYQAGKFEQCITACKKALELKPDYDPAYNNICAAYNEMNDWNNAIQAGTKGLEINPHNNLIKNNLAAAYKGRIKPPGHAQYISASHI